jgi:hypothetical protein
MNWVNSIILTPIILCFYTMALCKCLKISNDYDAFCNAIKKNHVTCVKTLANQGCELESLLTYKAASKNRPEIIRELVAANCPWNPHTFNAALSTGNLALVQYLEQHNCPLPSVKSWNYNGHISILRYLYERQYKLSTEICVAAAKNGWYDCLQYAITIGCALTEEVVLAAFNAGQTKILDLLYEHDCELPLTCQWQTNRKGQLQSLKHLEFHDLPLPIMK